MPKAARIGDMASGHACFPATPIIAGSSNVTINGIPAARKGDAVLLHACTCPYMVHGIHPRSISAGSSTVSINGKPASRVGDAIGCGGSISAGSGDVLIGNKTYRSSEHKCAEAAAASQQPFMSIKPIVDGLPEHWTNNASNLGLFSLINGESNASLTISDEIKKKEIGAEIPWPDLKPKDATWNPLPVDGVRKVIRVKDGIRLEMIPSSGLKKRFNLAPDETISIIYDLDGYPDFSSVRKGLDGDSLLAIPEGSKVSIDYAPLDKDIIESKGKKAAQAKARNEDFASGNEALYNINPELAKKAGAVNNDGSVRKGALTAKLDGKPLYTWHHLEDGKSMVLVDYYIHSLFKHSGGRSTVGG